jgi:nitroimidazol reductase NimA-like FMN-containing flavoprotein (pyridoxamine 5'-phosphate oxidase superfamily)
VATDAVHDSGGLQILSVGECRALLAAAPIGRIVFTDRALPAVQPVNFVMDDGCVVIRAAPGSKLGAAARDAVVAFEIDDFDAATRTGWSVVLVGHACVVTHEDELTRLRELPLHSWAPGCRDHFIRIMPEMITGRRITPVTEPGHR